MHDHTKLIEQLRAAEGVLSDAPPIEVVDDTNSDFDFETALDDIASMTPEVPVEAPGQSSDPGEAMRQQILDVLGSREDAPSLAQIEAWKSKYGKNAIKVFAGDVESVYVFTHLTAKQWDKVQSLSEKLQTQGAPATANRKIRDAVLKQCVLWPEVTEKVLTEGHAGLPDTLFNLIMVHSYFLSPQQALTLTTSL